MISRTHRTVLAARDDPTRRRPQRSRLPPGSSPAYRTHRLMLDQHAAGEPARRACRDRRRTRAAHGRRPDAVLPATGATSTRRHAGRGPAGRHGGTRRRRAAVRRARRPMVPQGGNTSMVGGAVPDRGRRPGRRQPGPHEPHPRRRSAGHDHGGRSRRPLAGGAGRRRRGRAACCRSRSAARAPPRSAASSRPMPAATTPSATATRATWCSGSRRCCRTARCCTRCAACARTTPATRCATCWSAPKARSASSPPPCSSWCRARPRPRSRSARVPSPRRRPRCSVASSAHDAAAIQAFEFMSGTGMGFVLRHIPGAVAPARPARRRITCWSNWPRPAHDAGTARIARARAGSGARGRPRRRRRDRRERGAAPGDLEAARGACRSAEARRRERQERRLGAGLARRRADRPRLRGLRRADPRRPRRCRSAISATATSTSTSNSRRTWTAADFLARADDIMHAVNDVVRELGGSFSAEHGVGRLKTGDDGGVARRGGAARPCGGSRRRSTRSA